MNRENNTATSHKSTNKAEQAFSIIKEKILLLEFPPEYPLREIELSQQLDMSRTPIRGAIDRLVNEGFAEMEGSARTIVSRVTVDSFMDIFALRQALEVLCVSLAAYAWEDYAEIQTLRDNLTDQKAMTESPVIDSRPFLIKDRTFHHNLALMSHNKLLAQEMMRVYDLYWRYIFYSMFKNRSVQIVQEHTNVLDAIEHRDGAAAQACMNLHLTRAKDEVMIGLAKNYNPAVEMLTVEKGYAL